MDDRLRHFSSRERLEALSLATGDLDARLLLAAADGAAPVAERARELWLEKNGSFCPVGELDGVPFLTPPASERIKTRLALLRAPVVAARKMIVAQLFAEAPDPEALALLTFAAADDELYGDAGVVPGRKAFAKTMMALFGGAAGSRALAWLAERYPVGIYYGWFAAAAVALHPERGVSAVEAAPLRELAERLIREEPFFGDPAVFKIVRATGGAPPALLPRLLSLVLTGGSAAITLGAAGLLLDSCPPGELARMLAALPKDDRERLEQLFASRGSARR